MYKKFFFSQKAQTCLNKKKVQVSNIGSDESPIYF